ncbi:neprilysin-2-like [Dermacentor albipictus]|uniref:neprilysin-2-like n=1 Tax=Dermacentor albipictus TaxID=60249 RepID=UPI0038FC2E70
MDSRTENTPSAPQVSSSSTQPEYHFVASTPLNSWSVSGSESAGDQSQTAQSLSPAAVAQLTVPVVEDDTSDHEAVQQSQGHGTAPCVLEPSVPTGFRSNAANEGAIDTTATIPFSEIAATSLPKKTLRLSYKDQLRLAAKETRNRSRTKSTAFDKAKAALKRRRRKSKSIFSRVKRPDMSRLGGYEPSYAGDSLHLSPLGMNAQKTAVESLNLADLAASHRGWFHGHPEAGDLLDEEQQITSRFGGVVHAGARLTSNAQELFLYSLALLLFITLLVVLAMIFGVKSTPNTARKLDQKSLICASEDCYQDAEYLSGLLSWDIDDPCDSLQPFVCRRWSSLHKDSPLTESISSDDVYVSSIERWAQAIYHNRPRYFRIPAPLRNLIDKCLNTEQIENNGWGLLLEFMFNTSLEGFPLTPPVRGKLNIWTTAASLLRKTGTAALLSASVASHPFIESLDVPLVAPPETLSASGVDIEEATRMYTAAVLSAVRGLNKDFVPPAHTMKTVEFARALEIINEWKRPDTHAEVVFVEPRAELVEFLSEMFSGVPSIPFVKNQANIWIQAPYVVTQILELVRKAESYVVLNYLCVRLMIRMAPFIPPSKTLVDFYSTLTYGKVRTDVPRWHICLRAMEKAAFPLFYTSLLSILGLYQDSVLLRFASLVKDITTEFLNSVESSSFFDKDARAIIKRIVSDINFQVLGPAWLKDGIKSMKYLSPVSNVTAFETYIELHERTFVETLALGSSGRWTRSAFSTTCWYERNPSTIYVPALAFNITLPLNEEPQPLHLCRAAVRVISCIFDAVLTETNSTSLERWLTKGTAAKLHNVVICYGLDKLHSPLRFLRDALTTEFAFRHFEKSVKSTPNSLHLRLIQGKILTSAQLFFVYLMLQRCEKKGGLDTLTLGSAHDLNVVLSRDANFAMAFNCSQGSPMNPEKQCS